MSLEIAEAEITAAGEPGPPKDDETRTKRRERPAKKSFNCYRCGRSDGHAPSQCKAINKTCNACKKLGHLARVCRSKTKDDKPGKRPRPHHGSSKNGQNRPRIRSVKSQWCQESYSSDNDINEPVLSLSNPGNSSSIQIKVNDKKIRMIVDTGSKYNIISSELYRSQFRYCELKHRRPKLTSREKANDEFMNASHVYKE